MTQNELQNELKMGLGTPAGPKVAKVGPRTPSGQNVESHFEPKWLPEGGHFEAKVKPKIMLISRVEKVGHLEGLGSPNGPSGPPKSTKTIGGVVDFSFSHFSDGSHFLVDFRAPGGHFGTLLGASFGIKIDQQK